MKIFVFFVGFFYLSAQKVLPLDSCIVIAQKNSYTLEQMKITQNSQDITIQATYAKKFPDLTFQSGNSYQFGFQSNLFGIKEIAQSYSNSNSLSSQVILYQGKTLQLQYEKAKEMLKNLNYSEKSQRLDLSLQVVAQFYSLLMQEQILKSQQLSMQNSEKNYQRMQKLYLHQAQSQKQLTEYELSYEKEKQRTLQAEYQVLQSKQKLKELLRISEPDFEISDSTDEPQELSYTFDFLYAQIEKTHPKIKQSESEEVLKNYDLKIAKNSWLPTLSARYDVYFNYLDFFNYPNDTYFNQLWDNQNHNFSLQLSFPIFNNRQSRSAIQLSKNALTLQQIETQRIKQELKNQVENLVMDYQNSLTNYKIQKKVVEISQKNQQFTELSFQNEALSVYDYLLITNENSIQVIEGIQLKYQLLFKQKAIELFLKFPSD